MRSAVVTAEVDGIKFEVEGHMMKDFIIADGQQGVLLTAIRPYCGWPTLLLSKSKEFFEVLYERLAQAVWEEIARSGKIEEDI